MFRVLRITNITFHTLPAASSTSHTSDKLFDTKRPRPTSRKLHSLPHNAAHLRRALLPPAPSCSRLNRPQHSRPLSNPLAHLPPPRHCRRHIRTRITLRLWVLLRVSNRCLWVGMGAFGEWEGGEWWRVLCGQWGRRKDRERKKGNVERSFGLWADHGKCAGLHIDLGWCWWGCEVGEFVKGNSI